LNRSADWLRQAEADLAAAGDSATADHHEWAAFQAQQRGEKAAKALLYALHGEARGHSITGILKQLPAVAVPDGVIDAARELDKVYVTARYPNGFASGAPSDYFTTASSRDLIQQARNVLDFCQSQIPRP
jgi:HEPN domain-containing protein